MSVANEEARERETWRSALRVDPLPFLLDEASGPSVRYLALRDLLELTADDPRLEEAWQAHEQSPLFQTALAPPDPAVGVEALLWRAWLLGHSAREAQVACLLDRSIAFPGELCELAARQARRRGGRRRPRAILSEGAADESTPWRIGLLWVYDYRLAEAAALTEALRAAWTEPDCGHDRRCWSGMLGTLWSWSLAPERYRASFRKAVEAFFRRIPLAVPFLPRATSRDARPGAWLANTLALHRAGDFRASLQDPLLRLALALRADSAALEAPLAEAVDALVAQQDLSGAWVSRLSHRHAWETLACCRVLKSYFIHRRRLS